MEYKRPRFYAFLLFVLFVALPFYASDSLGSPNEEDEGSIVWLDIDYPPMRILHGEQKGRGIGDMAIDLLSERLTDYRHQHSVVNLKRLFYTMKQKKNACSIGMIKTVAREKFLHYSIPALIRSGLSITIARDKSSLFPGRGVLSIAQLLKREDLKLGIVGKRSYTKAVDAVLEKHKGKKNVSTRQGIDMTAGLLKMLQTGRLDYVIEYPSQVAFVSEKMGLGDAFVTIGLQEAPRFTISHVVCSKSDWGKRVIEKANEILKRERPTEEYRSFMERWEDQNRIKEFREAYTDFLKKD